MKHAGDTSEFAKPEYLNRFGPLGQPEPRFEQKKTSTTQAESYLLVLPKQRPSRYQTLFKQIFLK